MAPPLSICRPSARALSADPRAIMLAEGVLRGPHLWAVRTSWSVVRTLASLPGTASEHRPKACNGEKHDQRHGDHDEQLA